MRKLALRCPKCTRELVVAEDVADILCPTCGYRGQRAPGQWEVPENLDGLRPGRQKALFGQHRPTAHVVLLTLLSFGVYALVYGYKAFKELDDQHGRLHSTWTYLFGVGALVVGVAVAAVSATASPWGLLLLLPAVLPLHFYWCLELGRMQDYRAARGLARGIGPGQYTLWCLLPVAGFIAAIARVNESMTQLWQQVYRETRLRPKLA